MKSYLSLFSHIDLLFFGAVGIYLGTMIHTTMLSFQPNNEMFEYRYFAVAMCGSMFLSGVFVLISRMKRRFKLYTDYKNTHQPPKTGGLV